MAKNMNIKCNFTSVFNQFETIGEITEVANIICAQVKDAFEARKKELSCEEIVVEAVVDVTTEDDPKPQEQAKKEEKKTDGKKADKKERAKEIAAKMRREKEQKVEPKKEAKKVEPKAEAKTETKSDDTLIAITDTKAIKKLGLTFEKYNDKCYVLRGETKPLRKVLKDEFKGVYNSRLTGGEGWVIASKYAPDCAKALGLKYVA